VDYYVSFDILEKSAATISRVTDFGAGGCCYDSKDENVLSIGYGATAWVVANHKYGKIYVSILKLARNPSNVRLFLTFY
jgi:hypothetical protein